MSPPKESTGESRLGLYILGQLDASEKDDLEERLFADEDLFQEALAVESDLIDKYVQGEMSPADRLSFEELLAASPEYRDRVEFARGLKVFWNREESAKGALRFRPPRQTSERVGPSRAKMWLTAAAVLLTILSSWLALDAIRLRRERSALLAEKESFQRRVSELEKEAVVRQAALEELRRAAGDSLPEGKQEATERRRPVGEGADRPFSFVLTAGLLREGSAANTLRVPEGVSEIRLLLPLATDRFDRYGAAITRVAGQEIWQQGQLRSQEHGSGRALEVAVPGPLLKPGDYFLTVYGRQKPDPDRIVTEYSFRVRRAPDR